MRAANVDYVGLGLTKTAAEGAGGRMGGDGARRSSDFCKRKSFFFSKSEIYKSIKAVLGDCKWM